MRYLWVVFIAFVTFSGSLEKVQGQFGPANRVNREYGVTRLRIAQIKIIRDELKLSKIQLTEIQRADIKINGYSFSSNERKSPQIAPKQSPQKRPAIIKFVQFSKPRSVLTKPYNVQQQEFQAAELKKINDQVNKEVAVLVKILNKKQMTRLDQIYLQMRGAKALLEDYVADQLDLTEEQFQQVLEGRKKLKLRIGKEFSPRPNSLPNVNPKLQKKRIQKIRQESEKEVFAVLTKKQTRKLRKMRGKHFQFSEEMKQRMFGNVFE